MKRSWWLAVIESHPCPVCGAGPGERCQTYSEVPKHEPHASRIQLADRCPKCGQRVAAEAGPLCDRCQLVRDLEHERAKTWKRHHP